MLPDAVLVLPDAALAVLAVLPDAALVLPSVEAELPPQAVSVTAITPARRALKSFFFFIVLIPPLYLQNKGN